MGASSEGSEGKVNWPDIFTLPPTGSRSLVSRCDTTVSFYNIFEECTAHLAAVTNVTALDVITLTSGNTHYLPSHVDAKIYGQTLAVTFTIRTYLAKV